ncbi:UNVERIFIED_CONTAM: hypothetical protein HDU68_004629 [Siphonaria sp. JEL0065]|nr:hypothetical protein HDU68_004629 [Siphonaria sp. JEL0065]
MSLMEARVHIRALEATLTAKDQELQQVIKKELTQAQELIASLPSDQQNVSAESVSQKPLVANVPPSVTTPNLQVRTSSESLPARASSESFLSVSGVTGIFNKLRRGSMLFEKSPDAASISTAATTTSEKLPLEEKSVANIPKSIAASIEACREWFQSAETFDFFISYRVATEAKIAMELYFRLKDQRIIDEYGHSRQIRVFWDKERMLEEGTGLERRICSRAQESRCVLMLVSPGAIEGMTKSNQFGDNVLLEWETAAMAGQRSICVPQPVNDIGPACATDISKVLTMPNLCSFSLSENPLGDQAIISICQGVVASGKSSFVNLELRKTNILDAAADSLICRLLEVEQGVTVKLDSIHGMMRVELPKKHPLAGVFLTKMCDAFFILDPDDVRRVDEYLRKEKITTFEEELLQNPDWCLKHVCCYIPEPEELYKRVKEVLDDT